MVQGVLGYFQEVVNIVLPVLLEVVDAIAHKSMAAACLLVGASCRFMMLIANAQVDEMWPWYI